MLDDSKYITTVKCNQFTARLKEADLATKGEMPHFVQKAVFDDKLKSSNENVNSNKPKHLLVENE